MLVMVSHLQCSSLSAVFDLAVTFSVFVPVSHHPFLFPHHHVKSVCFLFDFDSLVSHVQFASACLVIMFQVSCSGRFRV